MPKKFSDREKKTWLELYEAGKSDIEIARHVGCNVRTIRKGIQEARSAAQAYAMRDELLRKAVRDHQDSLLGLVNQTLSALVIPPPNLDIRLESNTKMTVLQLEGAKAEIQNDDSATVTVILNTEVAPEWELLQEHLKRDPMWNALSQWRRSIAAMIETRIALKKQTAALLEKRTGYKIVTKPVKPPELYYDPLVRTVFQVTLNRMVGIPDGTNLEEGLTADLERGEITHGNRGSVLARVHEAKTLEQCRKNMLKAIEDIQKSPEAIRVRETQREGEEMLPKVRRTVQEIRMLGMIPGECRICRRLGL